MNKELIKAIHSDVLSWMAINTKLMNSSIIYSVDTQSWHYFWDDPLGGPEDQELVSSNDIKTGCKDVIANNLKSEIRILESNLIQDIEKRLGQEYEDSDDLTDMQRCRLDMIAVNYVKLCGSM